MASSTSTLASELASLAASTITRIVSTHYTHKVFIDDGAGVYDCDCSGFVEHIMRSLAPHHFKSVPDSTKKRSGDKRPLARDFYDFFANLPTDSTARAAKDWQQIARVVDLRRGDILAWRLHRGPQRGDTGHVMIVAETPTLIPGLSTFQQDDEQELGPTFAIEVYDASEIQHFDDSRGAASHFKPGVGAGTIHISVDTVTGKPLGFRFHETAARHRRPIAVGRITGYGEALQCRRKEVGSETRHPGTAEGIERQIAN